MTGFQRLLTAGYRVFFLAAGLFAVFAMIVWEGWLGIHAAGGMVSDMPFAMAPHIWHAHELIFGYAAAAIAGFLMTAAPSWVGSEAARTRFFALASGVWLAGRLAVWFSGSLPAGLVMALDLSFLPVIGAKVAVLLLKRPKPRQMVFLVVLAVFFTANLMVHLEWAGLTADTAYGGLRAGLVTLSALIMVLGGRVTPAFTRNAMLRTGRETGLPRDPLPLAVAAIAAALALPVLTMAGLDGPVFAGVAMIAGLSGLARLTGWRGVWTLNQPILWSLHLGYAMNAAGLIALGLAALGLGSEIAALHLLGIGAVGGMTLAVMSRAALGHSGRPLVAPGPLALAYALLPLAAVARSAASEWPALYYPGVLTAGGLWALAFTLYLAELWPLFTGPRMDAGKETK
ncbi:NnrS family protein [Marimonas arenosa]|uniref:NnrS family protein n=1 Tax=Marimonas arenosa TaxID=1795305 RepID=A0AAE3WFK4_9RHOB|nr:NnrS family protein [Marimonas arenosa]MDQ2091779.1 NnrS family protein [Marimonas arenosa]